MKPFGRLLVPVGAAVQTAARMSSVEAMEAAKVIEERQRNASGS